MTVTDPSPDTAPPTGGEGEAHVDAPAAPAPRSGRRPDRESLAAILVPPFVVLVAAVGVWYLYSWLIGANQRNVSLPYAHDSISEAFFDGDNRTELFEATWVSGKVAIVGLVIAVALGVLFATLMSLARWVERSFYPYAILIQAVPILAIVPIIRLRFGVGLTSRVVVVVLISLFPIITNTLFGLKSAHRSHHDLFTLHTASWLTRLRKLQFPASLPAMFTGFQISAGLSVVGSIVGGFFFGAGEKGLGIRIRDYSNNLKPEQMVGGVILSAALGVLFFWFFGWLGRRATSRWYDGSTAA